MEKSKLKTYAAMVKDEEEFSAYDVDDDFIYEDDDK